MLYRLCTIFFFLADVLERILRRSFRGLLLSLIIRAILLPVQYQSGTENIRDITSDFYLRTFLAEISCAPSVCLCGIPCWHGTARQVSTAKKYAGCENQ